MKALCNEHRLEKGCFGLTLRAATVGNKCDCCDKTKGTLVSDKWKLSPNALRLQWVKKIKGLRNE